MNVSKSNMYGYPCLQMALRANIARELKDTSFFIENTHNAESSSRVSRCEHKAPGRPSATHMRREQAEAPSSLKQQVTRRRCNPRSFMILGWVGGPAIADQQCITINFHTLAMYAPGSLPHLCVLNI